jgi:peroxiredoxin
MILIKNKKWIQVVILSLLFVIGGYTIVGGLFAEKDKTPQEGDQAPDFSLSSLEGGIVSLSDFEGKAVMLNFWGTFCEPCVKEMPLIQQYYEQYQDQNLVVLGVNLDEPEVTVRGFVDELDLTFPIVLDKNIVRKQYGVSHYPTTIFINGQGEIIKKFVGEMKEKDLKPIISNLLTMN